MSLLKVSNNTLAKISHYTHKTLVQYIQLKVQCSVSTISFVIEYVKTKECNEYKSYSDFLFAVPFLQHLRKQNRQHFTVSHTTVMRMTAKNDSTSKLWY